MKQLHKAGSLRFALCLKVRIGAPLEKVAHDPIPNAR